VAHAPTILPVHDEVNFQADQEPILRSEVASPAL
jgi:hypothetical protein